MNCENWSKLTWWVVLLNKKQGVHNVPMALSIEMVTKLKIEKECLYEYFVALRKFPPNNWIDNVKE